MNEKLPFLVIGHRGCVDGAPEDTLMAVGRALDFGCKMIEIDVHVVDGVLVVHHDETVDRTSSGKGLLGEYSIESLRELDFGEGEMIPTLEEVLDLCLGRSEVNIELKAAGTAAAVMALLQRRNGVDRAILSSFEWQQMRKVRQLSDVPIAVLVRHAGQFSDALNLADELAAQWINLSLKTLTELRVKMAHDRAMSVAVYTVKSPEELKKVISSGADACFADDPKMVIDFLCNM